MLQIFNPVVSQFLKNFIPNTNILYLIPFPINTSVGASSSNDLLPVIIEKMHGVLRSVFFLSIDFELCKPGVILLISSKNTKIYIYSIYIYNILIVLSHVLNLFLYDVFPTLQMKCPQVLPN